MAVQRQPAVLGVDVGGTKIAAAPVDRTGRMTAPPLSMPTPVESAAVFTAGVASALQTALSAFADVDIRAVGVACAGTIDSARGVVVTSPNLPLREVALAAALEEALATPVILENDANAAAWAEAVVGAAAGHRHVVMLTLGTGVGGGLVLDGRLYRGAGGGAAELGHTIVCRDGELCACGARGCLEMYASGKALERFARGYAGSPSLDADGVLAGLEVKGLLDGRAVSRLAFEGHPGALAAVGELAGWLGVGLVGLVNTFNPEIVVIGGGVSSLGDLILEPAARVMRETALPPNRDQARVVRATLGNQAGLVGGGLAAWEHLLACDASGAA